mmetsp:Transcript_34956/g.58892  ORF Transcript_34956/g.58892 Transcript_34956/m.58892 type:complete len:529 (-) Transcript_34956:273-1859(-)
MPGKKGKKGKKFDSENAQNRAPEMGESPLMKSVMFGSANSVRDCFLPLSQGGMLGARELVDVTDPGTHVTPLMALAVRKAPPDTIAAIAQLLFDRGARPDTPDDNVGSFPVFMAAQEGGADLLKLLLARGAQIDRVCAGTPRSTTTPLWIAAQNGHSTCIALLAGAALATGHPQLLDKPNAEGKSPCSVAMEHGHAEAVGVLVAAGCDVHRASPAYYSLTDERTQKATHFDPSEDFPTHHALDCALRSHARKVCAHCGGLSSPASGCGGGDGSGGTGAEKTDTQKQKGKMKKLSRCAKCAVSYYCGRACQVAAWPSHKLCCAALATGAKGARAALLLYGGGNSGSSGGAAATSAAATAAAANTMPKPSKQVPSNFFAEAFGAEDFVLDEQDVEEGNCHDRATGHEIAWEFDGGRVRGKQPQWERYPPRIEGSLEALQRMGSPNFMYRPGKPDNDGVFERGGRSATPPASVATRHVVFESMTERETYTGGSRAVRRRLLAPPRNNLKAAAEEPQSPVSNKAGASKKKGF